MSWPKRATEEALSGGPNGHKILSESRTPSLVSLNSLSLAPGGLVRSLSCEPEIPTMAQLNLDKIILVQVANKL